MSSDSSEEFPEVPVWIGGVQKWITGITRRTTCDDVIYALLCQEKNPLEDINVQNFAIFERWREMEKPLRGRTKLMKVWRAWGTERHNVRFFVRKCDNMLDSSMEASRQRRPRKQQHREKDRMYVEVDHQNRDARHKSRSHGNKHKQSKSSSRDKHHQQQQQHPQQQHPGTVNGGSYDNNTYQSAGAPVQEDQYKSKEFHELVHRILDQERKIQEQLCRVREMDIQIENYDTKVHMLRMQQNGANYVQDAYLKDHTDSSSGGEDLSPGLMNLQSGMVADLDLQGKDLEDYLHMCDTILNMEEKLVQHQDKIQDLSVQIQEESVLITDPSSIRDALEPVPHHPGGEEYVVTNEDVQKQFDEIKYELKRSASLSSAQQSQMELVHNTLGECQSQLSKKSEFINELMRELDELDNEVYVDDIPHVQQQVAVNQCKPESSQPPQRGVVNGQSALPPLERPPSRGQTPPVSLPYMGGQEGIYSTSRDVQQRACDPYIKGHHEYDLYNKGQQGVMNGFTHMPQEHNINPGHALYTEYRQQEIRMVAPVSQNNYNNRYDYKGGNGIGNVYGHFDTKGSNGIGSIYGHCDVKGSTGINNVYGHSEQFIYNKHMSDHDSNSDTGLSSLHSDEAAVLETLV